MTSHYFKKTEFSTGVATQFESNPVNNPVFGFLCTQNCFLKE